MDQQESEIKGASSILNDTEFNPNVIDQKNNSEELIEGEKKKFLENFPLKKELIEFIHQDGINTPIFNYKANSESLFDIVSSEELTLSEPIHSIFITNDTEASNYWIDTTPDITNEKYIGFESQNIDLGSGLESNFINVGTFSNDFNNLELKEDSNTMIMDSSYVQIKKTKKPKTPPLEIFLEDDGILFNVTSKDLLHEQNYLKLIKYAVGKVKNLSLIEKSDYEMIEPIFHKELIENKPSLDTYDLSIKNELMIQDLDDNQDMSSIYSKMYHDRCTYIYPELCRDIIIHSKFSNDILKKMELETKYMDLFFDTINDPTSTEEQIDIFSDIFDNCISKFHSPIEFYNRGIKLISNLIEKPFRHRKILITLFSKNINESKHNNFYSFENGNAEIQSDQKDSQKVDEFSIDKQLSLLTRMIDNIKFLNPESESDSNEAVSIIEIIHSIFQIRVTPIIKRQNGTNIDLSNQLFKSNEFVLSMTKCMQYCEPFPFAFELCSNCFENLIIYTHCITNLVMVIPILKDILQNRASNQKIDIVQISISNVIHAFYTKMLATKDNTILETISTELIKSDVTKLLLDLFFKFPFCNILHVRMCQMMELLVLCKSDLLIDLIKNYNLLNRLIDSIRDRTTYQIMYGPLFRMFNTIIEDGPSSLEEFEIFCKSVPGFKKIYRLAQNRNYLESMFEFGKDMKAPELEEENLFIDSESSEDETTEEDTSEESTDEEEEEVTEEEVTI